MEHVKNSDVMDDSVRVMIGGYKKYVPVCNDLSSFCTQIFIKWLCVLLKFFKGKNKSMK